MQREDKVDVKELTSYANLSRQTIYNLVSTKKIPFRRISEKKVVFDRNEIDEWLKSREQKKKELRRHKRKKSKPQKAHVDEQYKEKSPKRLFKLKPLLVYSITVVLCIVFGGIGGFFYFKSRVHSLDISASSKYLVDLALLIEQGKLENIEVSIPYLEKEMVRIRLDRISNIEFSGKVLSSPIKPLLIRTLKIEKEDYALKSKAIDIIKPYIDDPKIREALIYVTKKEEDPSIRMKAVTVLAKVASLEDVKEALLDRLINDENIGIRFKSLEVIEKIVDEEIITVLEKIKKEEKDKIIKTKVEAIFNNYSQKT